MTPKTRNSLLLIPILGAMMAVTIENELDPMPSEATSRPGRTNAAGTQREYGSALRLGNGFARTYVVVDGMNGQPIELGVALDAEALEQLPTGPEPTMLHLALPPRAPEPYEFVMVDWNPQGHEPASVYTLPHFDFHFYTVAHEELAGIVPENPAYAREADNLPTGSFVPEHYVALAPPGEAPSAAAVPKMGVHWLDVRSPELQAMLGNPQGHQPFTRTFIYGSWNGEFTFYEPMITLAHLMSRPNEVIPIPRPTEFAEAGHYPTSYRISFDEGTGEYRIALTGLALSD